MLNPAASIGDDGRLIVFAHEAEAQAFEDTPHLVTGIGKVSAAVELARVLASGEVREVVVLGTAGMLSDGLDLDSVYRVREALQHDLAFGPPVARLSPEGLVEMSGLIPGRVQMGSVSGNSLGQSGDGESASPQYRELLSTAVIATGDTFVTDDAIRANLAQQGATLVDMESYAYASLGSAFQIPLKIFKIPSDFADSETTGETWDEIVARKSMQLREFAQEARLI